MSTQLYGYAGKFLRIDLTNRKSSEEEYDEATLRKYIGGTGFGAKILYEEVPPGVEWSDPENRLTLASGPLGGTAVKGSGTVSVVCKGPLTNGSTSSQANGFFGAFLRLSGYDGLIIQGAAPQWTYLVITEKGVEFRDAEDFIGKNTDETEDLIKKTTGLPVSSVSVASIGPAGENLVKFAAIVIDKGHVVAHNGPGAVMGSKKLKAIAVTRGKKKINVFDSKKLTATSNEFLKYIRNDPDWGEVYNWGMVFEKAAHPSRMKPIKNLQTRFIDISPEDLEKFGGSYIRKHYSPKRNSCWACPFNHCNMIEISEGPYVGHVAEEPEAECISAWGVLIGNTYAPGMIITNSDCDKYGLDANEAGWVVAFMMEMYDKGLITKADTAGIDLSWGNIEGVRALLRLIISRRGIGDILAEGVLRATRQIGGEAPKMAVYVNSGNTSRTHDLRLRWNELFDTVVSNICTIENDGFPRPTEYGLPPLSNTFDPIEVSTMTAKLKGGFQFLDSLGVCKFPNRQVPKFLVPMLQAATGWQDFTADEALKAGKRAINLFRSFNVRHGFTPDKEWPSPRMGSAPLDGPAQGTSILPALPLMLDNYYKLMGWDRATGKPLPETLKNLGLEKVSKDLWP
ncbi:MAG: aldehyde ferredoxin oxidoreductase C-terminal domain-containing protein [Dehalococcoidia bacterium]|nr:aldehyde ferredoxin oxidoreductase C-terminal domain-containing protein [Dehalococcoidia bacterium]MDZ4247231.1 aldehyde ferredoxin oxidoreductase C-terminal domain-containing protein [Dehalococcoidia bacterium]